MQILDWLQDRKLSGLARHHDRVEVDHSTGDHSTLWFSTPALQTPTELLCLGDLYTSFDGGDLFSSTFKIASVRGNKFRGTVAITPTLQEFANEVGAQFDQPATVFMLEACGWFYAVSHTTGCILSWDSEFAERGPSFDTVFEVFDAWLEAVDRN